MAQQPSASTGNATGPLWQRAGQRSADEGLSRAVAVTVLGSVERVRAAWATVGRDAPAAHVEFRAAPGDRGTEVHARLDPTEGADLDDLRAALRELKSLVECATVVSAGPQPSGRGPVREAVTRAVTSRLRGWGAA